LRTRDRARGITTIEIRTQVQAMIIIIGIQFRGRRPFWSMGINSGVAPQA
jgi:hypothetical protein